MEIYRIKDLDFKYPLSKKMALNKIDLSIKEGEFITICGKSGSGKSTLIRQLKPIISPHGERNGRIEFKGRNIEKLEDREQVEKIGYVLQNPDNQIVTDKVWHEMAFGLESLGYKSEVIRLRVAEMASYFGIQNWFDKKVTELSGGQKQILNLAGIMAMQPDVLILDEPTSQLDPIAASDFINTIKKINEELGITIIMTEHRLEEIIPVSDRIIVMDSGRIIADGRGGEVGRQLDQAKHPMFKSMTSAMQVYSGIGLDGEYPITVNDGRKVINSLNKMAYIKETESELSKKKSSGIFSREKKDPGAIRLDDVWFKYEKHLPNVLEGLSLRVEEGEIYCILGGNGTGKSTMLSLISGVRQPYRGKVLIKGKDIEKMSDRERYHKNLGILPQDPQSIFLKKTVREDLVEILKDLKLEEDEIDKRLENMAKLVELEGLLDMHPYDLSGGEQQRAALGKILLLEPKILVLDEPTKGMDNFFKEKLARILGELKAKGVTILIVSHDIEFCAKYGDRCAMMFNGEIITENETKAFFAGNNFYTTSANRMIRHINPYAITVEDVVRECRKWK